MAAAVFLPPTQLIDFYPVGQSELTPLCAMGIAIHDMPGERSYMFAPPNKQGFATVLQARLEAAH
jgi:hypothetical protein